MFIVQRDLNVWHPYTELFQLGEERKCCQLAAEEAELVVETVLTAYGCPLVVAPDFKYLGWYLSASDND